MRRVASRLSKLASLSEGERRDLVRAQLAVLRAQLAVWTHPHGRLVGPARGPASLPDEGASRRARLLANAVSLVSRHGAFRPNCLVRSLALSRLLESEQVPGWHVRIGVRERTGRFEAHAWVELGTEILADSSEHVASFEPLTEVRPVTAR
jgi:transglutaminase superfamily protein